MIIVKHHDRHSLKRVEVVYASHPVPDETCLDASKRLVERIGEAKLTERDLVFTVIGNGASSMMTYPWDGLDLKAVADVTRILQIEKGLTTPKLNIVRNQLDRLKGGRITRYLAKAKLVHLFPIDLNEPNAYNACGYHGHVHHNFWLHSLPDISTAEKAIAVLKESDSWDQVDESIRSYLQHPPAGHDVLSPEEFESYDNRIFGLMPDSCNFIKAVMDYSRSVGYEPHFLRRGAIQSPVPVAPYGGNGRCSRWPERNRRKKPGVCTWCGQDYFRKQKDSKRFRRYGRDGWSGGRFFTGCNRGRMRLSCRRNGRRVFAF